MLRAVTWVPDGGAPIHFGREPPFFFNRITDSVGGEPETAKAPRQDGQTTFHTSLTSRAITLTAQMVSLGDRRTPARGVRDQRRVLLGGAFLPKTWGTLIYHTNAGNKQIRCRALANPTITEETPTLANISIDFESDSAFWEGAAQQRGMVGGAVKKFRFPWHPRKMPYGVYWRWYRAYNPGAHVVWPQIEIFTAMEVVILTNETTGQTMKIDIEIKDGQKLVVDMYEMYAALWNLADGTYEDVSHWISLDSEPWGLVPGNNSIIIDNESNTLTPIVTIRWRELYGGV